MVAYVLAWMPITIIINLNMKKILDIYYKIMVGSIIKNKKLPANRDHWKTNSLTIVSITMGAQFWLLIMLFEIFKVNVFSFYNFNLDIFSGERLDGMLKGTILFFLPFFIINYFLIFWRDRYKIIIKKYDSNDNEKYYMIYAGGTFLILFILMFTGLIWKIITE